MIRSLHSLLLILSFWTWCAGTVSLSAEERDTQIESKELEMVSEEKTTLFVFSGEVKVVGTNLTVTCERLEVRTQKVGGDDPNAFGQIGAISSIIALGNVEIRQAGRVATAEKAELYPDEGRILLSGKPVVRDLQGEVSGERIVLLRNQRRAMVEGGGDRARVRLGQLPDLGFQEKGNGEESTETGETTAPQP